MALCNNLLGTMAPAGKNAPPWNSNSILGTMAHTPYLSRFSTECSSSSTMNHHFTWTRLSTHATGHKIVVLAVYKLIFSTCSMMGKPGLFRLLFPKSACFQELESTAVLLTQLQSSTVYESLDNQLCHFSRCHTRQDCLVL